MTNEQKSRWLENSLDRASSYLLLSEEDIENRNILFKVVDGVRFNIPIAELSDGLGEILRTVDDILNDCEIIHVVDESERW